MLSCNISIPYLAKGVHDCLTDKAKHHLRFLKILWNTYVTYVSNFFFKDIIFFSLLAEFTDLCPEGKGFIPSGESSYGLLAQNYKGQYGFVLSLIISEILEVDWLEVWASNRNILIQILLGDKKQLMIWNITENHCSTDC